MPWYDQYRKDIGPNTRRYLREIENEAREKLGLDLLPDPESPVPTRIERHTADNLTYQERMDYALRLVGRNV